ncbi:MAG: phosphoglycerate kinase [Patescibacteria group bacterium]
MRKIQEAEIENKNVLVRLDLDVTFQSQWSNGNKPKIVDDQRLKTSIQTINYLLENNASKITIIGHLDRPKGIDFQKSLWPVANRIAEFLGCKSCFTKPEQDYVLNEKIIIFDNLRFNPGEEGNRREFAQELVQGQDIFVQDAFASCHRSHASTVGIAKLLPSYAGFSVQKEVQNLSKILQAPKEGFTIIIGGKKAIDKLPVIENLLDKAEHFLIGGVVANTFLASHGYNLGKTLIENEIFPKAREILQSGKLILPKDLLFSKSPKNSIKPKIFSLNQLGKTDNLLAVDIGPETIASFQAIIKKSKTIFWNGNMGISEIDKFANGTKEIAKAIVLTPAKKYAGGGDTSTFIHQQKLESNFDFISLAGGAALNFLAGKILPGLEVLE